MGVARDLSAVEYETMKASFSGRWAERNRMVFVLGVRTGFRISEILSLNVGDVVDDMSRIPGEIEVRRSNMKGKKTSRAVAVHDELANELRKYLLWMDSRRINHESRPLFPDLHGKRLNRKEYWRIIKKAAMAAGLPRRGISTHTMRKSFASWVHRKYMKLSAAGEEVDAIFGTQEALGHVKVDSTIKYLRRNKAKVAEVVRSL